MTGLPLRSPVTGAPLRAQGHALTGPNERWPIIDGIPYLRAGREALAAEALARLDADDGAGALALLLADQDDWWTGPAPDPADLARLVAHADHLTLRDAVRLLGWANVGDYFLHRWSDPTYLAGLALLEAHWTNPATAFELACGIGHYLRDLSRRGVACTGADVVFAKLWVARRFVVPADVRLLCFDAAHPWPVEGHRFDLVMCHDAFYFLPDQPRIASRLRALAAGGGALAVSRVHSADQWNPPEDRRRLVSPAALAAMFPTARFYGEEALLWALLRGDAPAQSQVDTHGPADPEVRAWSLVEGAPPAQPVVGGLAVPPPGAALRPNPLLGDRPGHAAARWPNPRWRAEYGPGCFWANADDELPPDVIDPVRLRRLVDLPERW